MMGNIYCCRAVRLSKGRLAAGSGIAGVVVFMSIRTLKGPRTPKIDLCTIVSAVFGP